MLPSMLGVVGASARPLTPAEPLLPGKGHELPLTPAEPLLPGKGHEFSLDNSTDPVHSKAKEGAKHVLFMVVDDLRYQM